MKNKLELDDLKVESFITLNPPNPKGGAASYITECTECDPTAFNPPSVCNSCPTPRCTQVSDCGSGGPFCC